MGSEMRQPLSVLAISVPIPALTKQAVDGPAAQQTKRSAENERVQHDPPAVQGASQERGEDRQQPALGPVSGFPYEELEDARGGIGGEREEIDTGAGVSEGARERW
jgi:hypothetical protein